MRLDDHIAAIDKAVGDARQGLPEPVFQLVGRIMPIVNVDLLIRNDGGETLLTWRQDDLFVGWHLPGGVVRFKERMADRVQQVARTEVGTTVTMSDAPIAVHELIDPVRAARGHFVSFLFECRLIGSPDERLRYSGGEPQSGQWAWHGRYPSDMIGAHAIYRRFIERS
jgi:colanic acid biosynthesis protein WcaH